MIRVLAMAAAVSAAAAAAAPTCGAVPGWAPQGAPRSFTADNLFEYMDGNAEGYLIYGFARMQGVTCEKGGATFVIDLSEFADADSAYGMFSANRDPGQSDAKVGAGGQIVPRRAIFVKGKFYLEIAANPEGDHTAALQQWTTALEKTIEGSSTPPATLGWFPEERRQSLRLVPESVLGIRILGRGYVGQYEFGKAFLVTEASPESAAALMGKLRTRFGDAAPAKIADDAFTVTDRYLGRVTMFRKGRYIGGYSNVVEGSDPVALAGALAARLQ